MALDSFYIRALSQELNSRLKGQRIVKIHMPEKNKILLQLYGEEGSCRLLIVAGGGNPRICFTDSSYENPADPPMFCMLLRKYLTGAVITEVFQSGRDRILTLSLIARNALGDSEKFRIVLEMLGRSSNFLILDKDERIIDSLIRSGYKNDYSRCTNPGAFYEPPAPQNKTDLFEAENEEIILMCEKADLDTPVSDWLFNQYLGFSPLLCKELAFRASYSFICLADVLIAFKQECLNGFSEPHLYVKDGKYAELTSYELKHWKNASEHIICSSFSEAVRIFYSAREEEEQKRNLNGSLQKQVKSIRNRIAKKLAAQTEQLKAAKNAEEIRKSAELILANIYRIKKGDTFLRCPDYYAQDQHEVEIALDPLKTPQQNAASLFKEYNKKKNASVILVKLLEKEKLELEYLDSVAEEITRAENAADIAEIKTELSGAGFFREKKKSNGKKPRSSGPLTFETEDGFKIYVGRNNLQNEELTFRLARRTDIWFHVKNYHGSHVILSVDGEEPSEENILRAASFALKFSEAAGSGKQEVDYTQVRNVSKPSGAYPGRVNYRNYKTVIVSNET